MIFGLDYAIWFLFAALILAIGNLIWLASFEFRMKKLFRGKKAEDLQDVLYELQGGLKYFAEREKEMDEFLKHVEKRLSRSAKHLGIVRFNPYSGTGGDQSFSVAVLDEQRNGFVMSGLYARDNSRIYAKPVEKGESLHPLSGEEKEAIQKAINRYV